MRIRGTRGVRTARESFAQCRVCAPPLRNRASPRGDEIVRSVWRLWSDLLRRPRTGRRHSATLWLSRSTDAGNRALCSHSDSIHGDRLRPTIAPIPSTTLTRRLTSRRSRCAHGLGMPTLRHSSRRRHVGARAACDRRVGVAMSGTSGAGKQHPCGTCAACDRHVSGA